MQRRDFFQPRILFIFGFHGLPDLYRDIFLQCRIRGNISPAKHRQGINAGQLHLLETFGQSAVYFRLGIAQLAGCVLPTESGMEQSDPIRLPLGKFANFCENLFFCLSRIRGQLKNASDRSVFRFGEFRREIEEQVQVMPKVIIVGYRCGRDRQGRKINGFHSLVVFDKPFQVFCTDLHA